VAVTLFGGDKSQSCFPALTLDAAFSFSPKRDRSLVTAFPSPEKASACADSIPRVKGPGLLLRSLACRSFPLVRLFGSAASYWFAPVPGCIRASSPLYSLPACSAGCAARLSSPSGVFAPSGSKPRLASQPFGPPSGIARSSFAPRSLSIERFSYGSTFPIRYIPGGLL